MEINNLINRNAMVIEKEITDAIIVNCASFLVGNPMIKALCSNAQEQ